MLHCLDESNSFLICLHHCPSLCYFFYFPDFLSLKFFYIFHFCSLISKSSCFYFYSILFMFRWFNKMFFYMRIFWSYLSFSASCTVFLLVLCSFYSDLCLNLEVSLKHPVSLRRVFIFQREAAVWKLCWKAGLLTIKVPPFSKGSVLRPPVDAWNRQQYPTRFTMFFSIHTSLW